VLSYGAAALLALGLKEVMPEKTCDNSVFDFPSILKQALSNRSLMLFLLAAALLSETHQTVTVFLNQLQYEKCGLNASAIGGIYIVATLFGMVGIFSHRFTAKLNLRSSAFLFYGLATLACLTLALTDNAIPSIAGILALRIVHSLFQPMQSELQNRHVRSGHRATELSVQAMIINVAAIGTNLLLGAFAEFSLSAAFIFGAGICTAGLIFFGLYSRNTTL